MEAFRLFWGNPGFGTKETSAVFTKFEWADVEFFLLDDRTFRTPSRRKTGAPVMLGDKQYEWLIDSLTQSTATFKVIAVGGQVLNPLRETFIENYAAFPEEKEKLFKVFH